MEYNPNGIRVRSPARIRWSRRALPCISATPLRMIHQFAFGHSADTDWESILATPTPSADFPIFRDPSPTLGEISDRRHAHGRYRCSTLTVQIRLSLSVNSEADAAA